MDILKAHCEEKKKLKKEEKSKILG